MSIDVPTPLIAAAVVSLVLWLLLLQPIWRGRDSRAMKIAMTIVGLAPVIGPAFMFLLVMFPSPAPPDTMDHFRTSLDVTDRWRDRFEKAGVLPKRRQWGSRKR